MFIYIDENYKFTGFIFKSYQVEIWWRLEKIFYFLFEDKYHSMAPVICRIPDSFWKMKYQNSFFAWTVKMDSLELDQLFPFFTSLVYSIVFTLIFSNIHYTVLVEMINRISQYIFFNILHMQYEFMHEKKNCRTFLCSLYKENLHHVNDTWRGWLI